MSTTAAVKSADFRADASSMLAPGARLVSLDVSRGLTIAGMILVTDPGTYSAVYWPLLHAQWDNPTPTDMIFPSFLFISGMALAFSFASHIERGAHRAKLAWHLLRRCVLLTIIGLLVNGFPTYDWHDLRIPGILQRIALCYLFGGLLYLACHRSARGTEASERSNGNRITMAVILVLLGGYWAILTFAPVPGFGAGGLNSRTNFPAYIDRAVFGVNHMWAWGLTPGYGVTFDPEGLLSTLAALANLLIGVLAGEWMRSGRSSRRKIGGLAAIGAGMALVAWLMHPLLPINKKIWTSSFSLWSSGISLLLFAFFYWVVDVKMWRRAWTYPTLVLGTNAILAFVISSVITSLLDFIHVGAADGSMALHRWLYERCFATWLGPKNSSLAYAIMIVALNVAIVTPFYRRRIFLRV